mmetsp:Transcript_16376/g.29620  ORF Transcript_16376/g.29620 Transcript_16376/m.29620 type:complete len:442 (+) Transcript_16376:6-1331(+)
MLKMKAMNQSPSLRKPGGNEIARAHKLEIEVPSDDEELHEDLQPSTTINAKPAAPSKAERTIKSMTPEAKRSTAKSSSPVSPGKVFQFPTSSASQKPGRLQAMTPTKRQAVSKTPPKTSSSKASKPIIIRPPSTPQTRTADSPSRLPKANVRQRVPYKKQIDKPTGKRDDSSLATLVTKVAQKSKAPESSADAEIKARADMIYKEHLFNTFQALKFVKSLPPVDPQQLNSKKVVLSRRPGYESMKTVVFDLDETLVHCVDDPTEDADVRLPVTFPNGDVVEAGINIRPYAVEALKAANKEFEVIVFTASHSCYADVVLDYLDPDRLLIHHRFYREHCIVADNVHIKDLRIFANRRLQDTVLVDNAAYSFGYQIDNGIPIISWHNDSHDKELYNLIEYLHSVAKAEDVRILNRKTFRLNTFYEDYLNEYLQTKALSPKRSRV